MGTALDPDDLVDATLTFNVSNTAGDMETDSFVFDETAPNIPTGFMIAMDSDSGNLGDNTTQEAMPVIEFMAETGSTVEVFDSAGMIVGAAMEVSPGQFTIAVPLTAEGSNSFTAVATDAADNSSPAASFTVTLDTTGPSIGTIALAMASDSGVAMDSITNVASPTIEVMADTGSVVEILNSAGMVVGMGVESVSTPGTFTVMLSSPLTEGANMLTVRATDAAENSNTVNFTVTLDTMAPTVDMMTFPSTNLAIL